MSPEKSQPQQPAKLIEMPEWDAQGRAVEAEPSPEAESEGIPFAIGEAVSVSRSNGRVDYIGWVVESSSPELTVVVNPENGLSKKVSTPELKQLQRRLDEKLDRDLGGTAVDDLVERPTSEVSGFVEAPAEVGIYSPEVRQVLTPQELMNKLTEGMSEQDKRALLDYAYGREDKSSAQKDGRGEASTRAGYDMGDAMKRMSPVANDLKNRFADYYDRSQR